MSFWSRLAVTAAVMVVFSVLLHVAWQALTGFAMPAYLAGVAGGLIAVPVWEYLQMRGRSNIGRR